MNFRSLWCHRHLLRRKSRSVLNTRCLGKEKDIVWLLPCHVFLPPSSMFSHSLWQLVAHTILRWLDRRSILICSGDTAPFDISPKNWLLWWFFSSLRACCYSGQFTVWKRPRGNWLIVFLTSSIQFVAATRHTSLHVPPRSCGPAHTTAAHAHIQMCRFPHTHKPTSTHTGMHQIREIGVISWLLLRRRDFFESVKMKAWGEMSVSAMWDFKDPHFLVKKT